MKYLITSALPYANGPLHFGHLVGAYLPADVYTRYRRLQGHTVKHISGSDEHGVAIMLNAKKVGKNYQEYVNAWHKEHKELFQEYQVDFDFFGQTSASYHKEEVVRWFLKLNEKGAIETKDEQQLFCNDCKNHLPDRFVEGTCYVCGFENARGDECPSCGEWILPVKLKNPICKMCDSRNISVVKVTQYYLLLSKYHSLFQDWFATKRNWRKTVVPYVDSLSKDGLQDRAITRDLDWGIDVPLPEAKGKKLYVWFDAPIGYVSNMKEHLRQIGSQEDYIKDWWKNEKEEVDIVHFIGKDNIIFHCMIFPMMSMLSGFINPPSDVPANQYLNLEGKQFSKSSGWYVDAKQAIHEFGADALRFYLISLIPETSDSSFTWGQFALKVNSGLSNNIGNFVNRCLKFFHKNWPEGLDGRYFQNFHKTEEGVKLKASIDELNLNLNQIQIRKALETLMGIGQDANTYFTNQAPWAQYKVDVEACSKTMASSCLYVYVLGVLFSPFLPGLSEKILSFFRVEGAEGGKDKNKFEDKVTEKNIKEIYQGQLELLDRIFAKGLKLWKAPEGLVPKIDEQAIIRLENELKNLSS